MLKASLSIVLAALNCTLIGAGNLSGAMPSQAVTAGGNRLAPETGSQADTSTPDETVVWEPILADVDPNAPIQPRTPLPKLPVRGPGSLESMLSPDTPRTGFVVFKLRDELKARTGMSLGTAISSAAKVSGTAFAPGMNPDRELDGVRAVLADFHATVRQNILIPPAELAAMEARARAISRVEQPDLAGMMIARPGSDGQQAELAEALNALPSVEFAHIQYLPTPAQSSQCIKDVSLQRGGGTAGGDIILGTDCSTYTNDVGIVVQCDTPPPVFIGQPRSDGLGGVIYSALPAPNGVIACQAPDRWFGFTKMVQDATGCGTVNVTYTQNDTAAPTLYDCTPNCNQSSACTNPPGSYTSIQFCQYGCQDFACSQLVSAQGFTMCNDPTQSRGWDALCATIANIYCSSSSANGPTPYRGTGPFEPFGRAGTGWLADPATSVCYGLVQSSADDTGLYPYSFGSGRQISTDGDASVYDSCFALRGPANPPEIDTSVSGSSAVAELGILSYADVGNGEGVRPWGFDFVEPPPPGLIPPARAYANAFLDTSPGTSGVLTCQFLPTSAAMVGGQYLWNIDPNDPSNAESAEYNFSLKSYPYSFSHDCITRDPVTPGCFQTPCCVFVCTQDPSCCTVAWDSNCVSLAQGDDICRTASLNTSAFPNDFASPTPDFTSQPTSTKAVGRSLGLQMWNTGNTIANTCLEYINANPSAEPGLISLQAIANQNELSDTAAFLNCGFGGGGIPIPAMEDHALKGYKVPPRALHGNGRMVGVVDYAAFVNHSALKGRVVVEPNQTIVLTPTATTSFIDPDHGTAVLGILVAQMVEGLGTAGLGGVRGLLSPDPRAPVPDPADVGATAMFFPGVSVQEGGRVPTAIARAGQMMNPGDVLCIPLAFDGSYISQQAPTISALQETNAILSVVRSLGITSVVAAGNGGFQSIVSPGAGETFCVTVGACWPGYQVPQAIGAPGNLTCPSTTYPGEQYCRYRTSNWTAVQGPDVNGLYGIDVAGWGTGICTLGKGTLWNGKNLAENPSNGSVDTYSFTDGTVDRLRSYQLSFGDTSGASAMIAGLVVSMQGFAESVLGSPVSPTRIREILANQRRDTDGSIYNLGSCVLQCGGQPGTALPTTANDNAITVKNGDLLLTGGSQHNVGGFPRATVCLDEVAATTFNPQGTPFQLQVVKGTIRSGNGFSCARLDNGFLKIQAARAARGSAGQGYGPPFPYAANGLATDVQLRAITRLQNNNEFTNMSIAAYGAATAANQNSNSSQNNALVMMYVYNRVSNRWNWLALNYLTNQVPVYGASPLAANLAMTWQPVTNFLITEGTQRVVYFRVVTYPFGIIGPYQTWWDLFDISTNPVLPR